jgi:hypothetical protein
MLCVVPPFLGSTFMLRWPMYPLLSFLYVHGFFTVTPAQ